MPDGLGFRDSHMNWAGNKQQPYRKCIFDKNIVDPVLLLACHAELNAAIAAFRREADIPAYTVCYTFSLCVLRMCVVWSDRS